MATTENSNDPLTGKFGERRVDIGRQRQGQVVDPHRCR
jgi:hypothetical protein